MILPSTKSTLNETNKKYFYYGLLVAFTIIATFISWGYSRDSGNYNRLFEMYGLSGWSALPHEVLQREMFFLVASKALYQLGLSSVYLFFIFAVISLLVKFYLIDKYSKDKWLSVAFFSSYFFILHDSTQIRFSMAVASVYLGLHFLADNKKLMFSAIVIFSAVMFHNAILVFIIMLFFTNNKSYLWAFCLVLVAIMLYQINLNPVVFELVEYIVNFFDIEGTRLNRVSGLLLRPSSDIFLGMFRPVPVLVYFCAIVIYQFRERFNAFEVLCYNALLLSIFCYILLKDIPDLQVRFADMFGFSLVFLVPYVHRALSEYIGGRNAYIVLLSFFAVHLIKYTIYDKMLVL